LISPTGLATDPPDIEREVLLRDVFVVVLSPRHRLADRKRLSLAQLRDEQWVMLNAHTTMSRQIEALFAAENESWPTHCTITNSVTALKSLVMRSNVVSIVSRRLVGLEAGAGYLICVPLRKPHFTREVCLRRRRNASPTPLVQRFVAAIRIVAAAMHKKSNDLRSIPFGGR
jgi:LysR family transcriptional regulator of gallate degradation